MPRTVPTDGPPCLRQPSLPPLVASARTFTPVPLSSWLLLAAVAAAIAGVTLWLTRRTREALRARLRRAPQRALHEYKTRLSRYQLQQRRHAKTALLADPVVVAAIADHAAVN